MLNGSMGEPSDDNVTDMSELEGESLAAKEAHKDGARQCAVKENWQVNKKVKTPRVHLQGADEDAQMVVLKMMMMVQGDKTSLSLHSEPLIARSSTQT